MATDAKKHTTIAAGETPTRAALASAILGMNDVVPVAGATEQAQIVNALASTPYAVSASRPLTTARQDAPGLHRIEISDGGGAFVPASGVLHFATKAAADSWAATYSALLVAGDICFVGADQYTWSGAQWFGQSAVSPASGITFSPNRLSRNGSLVTIHAYAAKGSAFAAAELVGTIPTGFRPSADWAAATLHYTGGYGVVQNIIQINTAGEIRVNVAAIASQYAFIVGTWPV